MQRTTSKLEETALERPGAQLLPRGGGGGQGPPRTAAGFWPCRMAGGVGQLWRCPTGVRLGAQTESQGCGEAGGGWPQGRGPGARFLLPSFLPSRDLQCAPQHTHEGPGAEPRVCREARHSRSLGAQGWRGPQHAPRPVLWGPCPALPQRPLPQKHPQLCFLPPGPLGP